MVTLLHGMEMGVVRAAFDSRAESLVALHYLTTIRADNWRHRVSLDAASIIVDSAIW